MTKRRNSIVINLLNDTYVAMACFTNPCLSEQRIELTKFISLIYIVDDIFDVYGTLDQITLFIDAIIRFFYIEK